MSSSRLSVTIVTPAFNEAENIGNYLDSLVNQSFKDFDVVIIDDGSTDNTATIVRAYRDRLRLTLKQTPNLGWKVAKARGTAKVTSDICIVFDADILSLPCFNFLTICHNNCNVSRNSMVLMTFTKSSIQANVFLTCIFYRGYCRIFKKWNLIIYLTWHTFFYSYFWCYHVRIISDYGL